MLVDADAHNKEKFSTASLDLTPKPNYFLFPQQILNRSIVRRTPLTRVISILEKSSRRGPD